MFLTCTRYILFKLFQSILLYFLHQKVLPILYSAVSWRKAISLRFGDELHPNGDTIYTLSQTRGSALSVRAKTPVEEFDIQICLTTRGYGNHKFH